LDPTGWPVYRLPHRATGAAGRGARSPLMFDIQALQGCRVLDVASFLGGPFAPTQPAAVGAEENRVELPGGGEAPRRFGTMTECGDSLPWLSESRKKKCI